MRTLVFVLVAACGAPEVAPQATTRAAASPIATSTGPTDEIVAQVNGRPVWASCVAAQGAKLPPLLDATKKPVPESATARQRRALDECIAFELLAQEADKRGLASDADVVDATRTAIVNRLVETGFEQKYTKPADLGTRLEKWYRDNEWRMHRPELRSSTYLRVLGDSAEAQKTAQAIYDQLANETGLFTMNLEEVSAKLPAGSPKTEVAVVPINSKTQLDPSYANALFALPDVGRVSPPTKTPWGWDVILWTGGLPPKETTRDEAVADAFPDLRRSMFPIWVNQIALELGVKPEIDQAQLARLDEVGP